MVRRHERSRMAPSAYVFPGGVVRDDDYSPDDDLPPLHEVLNGRSDTPVRPDVAVALYTCALRELFEEAGVLLVRRRSPAQAQEHALESLRTRLQAGGCSFADVLAELEAQPAHDALVPFSHWVTPQGAPVRFDTRFFVAAMPAGQEALHCAVETTEGVWLRPTELLDGTSAGRYALVYATETHVRRIASFSQVAELLAFASTKPVLRCEPVLEHRDGQVIPAMPEHLAGRW